jgi:hypothetical protein
MADLNEPKKETVRITLPPRAVSKPHAAGSQKETVRINLPNRSLGGPLPRPASSTPVRPPPSPVAPRPLPPAGGAPAVRPPAPPMARPPAPIPSGTKPVAPPPVRPPMPAPPNSLVRPPSTPPLPTAEVKPAAPPLRPSPMPPVRPPVAPVSGVRPATPTPSGVIPPPNAEPLPPTGLRPPPPAPAARPATTKLNIPPSTIEKSNGPAPTGPRKETARIAVMPEKPMKATVRLGSIAPSTIPAAGISRPAAPVPVAVPAPAGLVESVPTSLCWALLGISALTLLIQLWTYFS